MSNGGILLQLPHFRDGFGDSTYAQKVVVRTELIHAKHVKQCLVFSVLNKCQLLLFPLHHVIHLVSDH